MNAQIKLSPIQSNRSLWRFTCILVWIAGILTAPAPTGNAQERSEQSTHDTPRGRTTYLGRRIAPVMGYQHMDWLFRDTRMSEEDPEQMFEQLGIQPGMTVCDMGCGSGFYTLRMAKAVGEEGRVLAVDIQPQMLQALSTRAGRAGLENIEMVLGEVHDPKLPEGEVDLILMVDVYHEFSHPEYMLQAMRNSLTEDGVIALVEFRKEDPRIPIQPLHKMSKKQIMKEYERNGFRLVREFDDLPIQHLMLFGRDDSAELEAPN